MKIYGIANSIYQKPNAKMLAAKAADTYQAAYRAASKSDRIEISSKAYEAHTDDENLTATSGKDILEITKGNKDGSFVIHFSDSAIVSRAVSRGYITVNGTNITLTDEIKKQLISADRQAQAERERAFNEYVMQHELAVAQQQGEAYGKVIDDMSKAFETAAKLSRGCKVSPAAERQLLEMNPQLYAMSKMVALMAKQQEKRDDEPVQMHENNQETRKVSNEVGVPTELKSYQTDLAVSLSDTVQLQDVSVGEIDIKV